MIADERVENSVQPAIVGLMVGCAVLSLVSLAAVLSTGRTDVNLAVLCGLTALGAGYSYRHRQRNRSRQGIMFRVLELASLFVVQQLWRDVVQGQSPLQGDVPRLDGRMIGLFLPVLLSWLVATEIARDLARVGEPPTYDPHYVPPQRRLAALVFTGGALLAVAAWLTGGGIELFHVHPGSVSGPVWNVLLYVLLGTALLGWARYTTLWRRWHDREIVVAAELTGRWAAYSLTFIGLVAILALLFSTGHLTSLLDLGRALWDQFLTVATRPVTLVRQLLERLISLLHPSSPPPQTGPVPPDVSSWNPPHVHTVQTPPLRQGHATHDHWGTIVKALMLWCIVLTSVMVRIRLLRRRRRGHGASAPFTLAPLFGVLSRIWAVLRRGLRGYARLIGEHVPRGRGLRPRSSTRPSVFPRFTRSGALSPREQVLSYYHSIVRQADRKGVPRRPSQTPHEFSASLAPRLHAAQGEMQLLTEAFVAARYSPHEIDAAQAGQLRDPWKRVRAALGKMKKA